ncbi:MAG: sialate O-acetylesterase [Bacteroidales bacterium]|nr:sialate O-acetylesterase [Bacteroidales bacterium]MDD5910555.1 sialate O-acetylesterase [Bacteroidales bacterium]
MKKLITILATLATTATLSAKVTLPEIIGDNMVLQQQTQARLWGKAAPKSTVTITPSWNNETIKTKADKDGNWIASVQTPKASYTEHSIVISDGEPLTISNVLIGEVWFCGGQSNMEMPLNGFWDCPIEGSNQEIATAARRNGIRLVKIPKTGTLTPSETVEGKWELSNPQSARWFSATAWYFARLLNEALDIPVGLLSCNWGGTRVESWLPEEIVRTYGDIDYDTECCKKEQTWWHYSNVTIMYNGMYYPIRNYTVRGFIWYQGEANVGKHDTYPERFRTLVNIWRENQGCESPVYLAELAPWLYGGDGTSGARFREMQHNLAKQIPSCGVICTNDLVYPDEDTQIHPRNKKDVGERLAYLALNQTYKQEGVECRYPEYKSFKVEGDTVEVFFDNAEDGLSPWKGLEGFEVAGEDKVFHKAEAWVHTGNKSVYVRSSEVAAPVAVRYCFRDFQIGNLRSGRDLPVMPFRTDNW